MAKADSEATNAQVSARSADLSVKLGMLLAIANGRIQPSVGMCKLVQGVGIESRAGFAGS